ncbi:hypothetical protein MMAN_09590 [Mycobacterium mantenii]|uniref:Uncharacterized protein n=1 Tax=Mycobacterium mantenii TaxID=560555 RepID=A0A1X0G0G7_MYCNT|nr:hypothetical protein BST30_06090 [Mycobacterium mantenii]BBY36825.1 hypothetical protein MMAN_09590 [Mycobacterium mantenii]
MIIRWYDDPWIGTFWPALRMYRLIIRETVYPAISPVAGGARVGTMVPSKLKDRNRAVLQTAKAGGSLL